jgi:hypothetical protein
MTKLWPKGFCPNPRGRPRSGRGMGVWSSKEAIAAFARAGTVEQRQKVAQAVLDLACKDGAPQWALQAVADAGGLDKEYIRRTGRLPKGKTYVWG